MHLIGRTLLSTAMLLGVVSAIASEKDRAPTNECPRKFSDAQIQRMLPGKLAIGSDGGMSVRYQDCSYRVLLWPAGHPVDSDVFVELDRDGNLPPEVIKYGWHGDRHEEVSLRKALVPPYPTRALAAKMTGSVVIRATVTPNSLWSSGAGPPEGFITDVHIVHISPPEAAALSEGLIDALHAWRFNPRISWGTALPSDIMMRFRYSIDGHSAGTDEKVEVPEDVAWQGTMEIKR